MKNYICSAQNLTSGLFFKKLEYKSINERSHLFRVLSNGKGYLILAISVDWFQIYGFFGWWTSWKFEYKIAQRWGTRGYDILSVVMRFCYHYKYAPGNENLEAHCFNRNAVFDSSSDFGEVLKVVNIIEEHDIEKDRKTIEVSTKNEKNNKNKEYSSWTVKRNK